MKIKPGLILLSTPLLDDFVLFTQSAILIASVNEDGAVGFILNKIFERRLNELEEFASGPPLLMYIGGPVDFDKLYIIHSRPDLIKGGTPIFSGLHLSGDLLQAVQMIGSGEIDVQEIKVFVGYCGWDPGQLEAEIAEGSWSIVEHTNVQYIFNPPDRFVTGNNE